MVFFIDDGVFFAQFCLRDMFRAGNLPEILSEMLDGCADAVKNLPEGDRRRCRGGERKVENKNHGHWSSFLLISSILMKSEVIFL